VVLTDSSEPLDTCNYASSVTPHEVASVAHRVQELERQGSIVTVPLQLLNDLLLVLYLALNPLKTRVDLTLHLFGFEVHISLPNQPS
jgi:hypothetical protein